MPQCEGCGVVYALLQGLLCGLCKLITCTEPKDNLVTESSVTSMMDSMRTHQTQASQHHINHPSKQPPNKGLQNATEAARCNQAQKVLSRLNTISLLGNLWVYPANGGTAKVIQHPMSKYTGISSIAASEALNAFTLELLSAYNGLQGNEMPGHGNLSAFITCEKLCFSVQKDASTLSPLKPTGSLADMHSQLSRDNELSTKDVKSNSITLQAYVWQPKSRKQGREGVVHSDDGTDTDDNNTKGKILEYQHQNVILLNVLMNLMRGRDKDTDVALFQMNPGWSKWPVSEEDNEQLLLQGLIALTTADYFMQSFHCHAIHYSVYLPSLQFNSKGAFLGVVETGKISPHPEATIETYTNIPAHL
ncbi:hypothetical protein JB92DRAFT_3273572 [Gautieria morchelliformis]|nr:hypothetical protein JB92DRAFT_3273572 [Gautieria morchelliformis]